MSTTTATSTITNDISFTLLTTGGGQSQTESSSLAYTRSLSNATGTPGNFEINFGVIASGTISSGTKTYVDFRAITKNVFGASSTVQFTNIHGLAIQNEATTGNENLAVYATGSNALSSVIDSTSTFRIKPYAVWSYADPISGSLCSASVREIAIENQGTGSIPYQLVVVGVTG